MPSEFIEGLRSEVRAKQAGPGVQDARTEVAREHLTIIGEESVRHAAKVLLRIMVTPDDGLRLICGRHDAVHGTDDPTFDWLCIASMARAEELTSWRGVPRSSVGTRTGIG